MSQAAQPVEAIFNLRPGVKGVRREIQWQSRRIDREELQWLSPGWSLPTALTDWFPKRLVMAQYAYLTSPSHEINGNVRNINFDAASFDGMTTFTPGKSIPVLMSQGEKPHQRHFCEIESTHMMDNKKSLAFKMKRDPNCFWLKGSPEETAEHFVQMAHAHSLLDQMIVAYQQGARTYHIINVNSRDSVYTCREDRLAVLTAILFFEECVLTQPIEGTPYELKVDNNPYYRYKREYTEKLVHLNMFSRKLDLQPIARDYLSLYLKIWQVEKAEALLGHFQKEALTKIPICRVKHIPEPSQFVQGTAPRPFTLREEVEHKENHSPSAPAAEGPRSRTPASTG